MKALVQKEIRMLLPAFGGALMLAVLPDLLAPDKTDWGTYNGWLFMFGIMMLGVSAFGREMGLKTIPFILAQPLNRSRIWWTKILVLAVCTMVVFVAWFISMVYARIDFVLRNTEIDSWEALAWMALVVVVLITGGVWMTLLVRQMAAAFWLAYLVPAVIGVGIKAIGGADWIVCLALCLYSATAFFLARRQFLQMQDTGWSGATLTLGRASAVGDASSSTREQRPWGTLFRKELKLHTFTLAGIAALFVVHLGVIAVRKIGGHGFSEMTLFALESFGMVWIIVPFVAGSQSVAEERQNGTLDGLLCLSVSRWAQFIIKMFFVLVLGGLLSAVLLCGAETMAGMAGAGTGGVVGNYFDFSHIVVVFLALSVVGFYASTLTRSVAQALAVGVVVVGAYAIIRILVVQPVALDAFGLRLWPAIAAPALTLAIIWLSYGNFKWTFESGRRWRRNIFTLATVIVVASVSAATVYHRAWGLLKWATPSEGAHGPAIIPPGNLAKVYSTGWPGIAVLLPDGRLWSGDVGDTWNLGGNFMTGSNWVDVALLSHETVAIRSDGTLWVSEKPGTKRLVQFGGETDWQSVVQFNYYTVALLKRDGTLWTWGPMEHSPTSFRLHGREKFWGLGTNTYPGEYPGLRSLFTPVRFHPESEWARIIEGQQCIYAWKQDGDAWVFNRPEFWADEGWSAVRLPALDHLQFKSPGGINLWIRNDGTLWWHRLWTLKLGKSPPETKPSLPELVQMGKDADWVAAAWHSGIIALKTDGSIWEWRYDRGEHDWQWLDLPPERFGTHSDWVGLGKWNGQAAGVAADGSLWLWPRDDLSEMNANEWLAPTDRPSKIASILTGNEHH